MIIINEQLVQQLVEDQFPQWSGLPIRPVEQSGHDNRTYRLGDTMAVRLPSHERYAAAVEKEWHYLPILAKQLSLPITTPIAKGAPTNAYPLPWLVNSWLEGEPVTHTNIDQPAFALNLAAFLAELSSLDASEGIPAGVQNFHRGGNLAVYDTQTREAIQRMPACYDREALTNIWGRALASTFRGRPVWVHGDIAVGNLLAQDRKLCGVIDFGTSGVGDPACDYVIAWTFLNAECREAFFDTLQLQPDMIDRARGWALWKALITYCSHESETLFVWAEATLDAILAG